MAAILILVLAGLAVVFVLIWTNRRAARRQGEAEATATTQAKVIDNVEKANRARRNPDAGGVRRFDRPGK